ncbi:hypothetical protein AB733_04195 [Photobacterium swingsii]|uniref:LysR family transcriptional regulator n=1 Tax=Photobacterium swingsii TaxID=680026 RepID=A0A0J8Y2Z4_9GAMM|nr:LysR family transcriptional regulator [Photobacterium swingsii]KMV31939.1 hypothetical protein AB733_04195 [Photobacterium swingsii]PSW25593.1 LysR family transcriptional regulator [Photobacterium swingsii]
MARSFEQLEAFVESVEAGGFKAASRRIGKHAVTISGLVAKLESELGFELFTRKPRSLELTEKGTELYNYAKSAMHELEYFDSKADSLLNGIPSSLTLAIDPSLYNAELIDIYNQLFKRFPTLDMKILSGDPLLIRNWVLTGQADVGFSMTTLTQHHELSVAHAFSFAITMVAHPQLDISPSQVSQKTLRRLPQVSLNYFHELGLKEVHEISHRITHCTNMHDILAIVKGIPSWTAAPKFLVDDDIEKGLLKPFTLDGGQFADWHAEVLWRSEKTVNDAMAFFIDRVLAMPKR